MPNATATVSISQLIQGLTLILRCLERYATDLTVEPRTNPEAILQNLRDTQENVRLLDRQLDARRGDMVDIEPCAPAKGEGRDRRREIYGTTVIPC
jgi:hypothetical protein